jgi:hypothetical protein
MSKTYTVLRLNWEGLDDDDYLREDLTEAEAIETVAEWTATRWLDFDEELLSCTFEEQRVDIFVFEGPMVEFDEDRVKMARKKFEDRNLAAGLEVQREWKKTHAAAKENGT